MSKSALSKTKSESGSTQVSSRVTLGTTSAASLSLQRKLTVNTPGDKYEQEADRVAEQVMRMPEPQVQRQCGCGRSSTAGECSECKKKKQEPTGSLQRLANSPVGGFTAPPIVNEVLSSPGSTLPTQARLSMESRFGQDFSHVRIHTDSQAIASASSVNARAYTVGNHVVFGQGESHASDGGRLLAHELVHVQQQHPRRKPVSRAAEQTKSPTGTAHTTVNIGMIARKTTGEIAMDKAEAQWIAPDASVKADVDVIKAALQEVKKGKNVAFNKQAVKTIIASASATLGRTKQSSSVISIWDWLVNNRLSKASKNFRNKETTLLAFFETPFAGLAAKHPKAQTKYWLRNTPPQIMDEIISVADAELPADQLWSYAYKEGLVNFVRDQIGLATKSQPNSAQLTAINTKQPISGFGYLGTDDFWNDLNAKNEPASAYLPASYDLTKVSHESAVNEKGRPVDSAKFPELKMGLQALAALLKRRRALFQADVGIHGYSAPTIDEVVYWTYVYFNSGENNGQLKKYKGKRALSDWINKGEYPNAIKLLQSYRMIKDMKVV